MEGRIGAYRLCGASKQFFPDLVSFPCPVPSSSPPQNHHCSVCFKLLHQTGLLAPLDEAERLTLRKTVVEAILSTDMSQHKALLQRVEGRLGASNALSRDSADDRKLLVAFLVHCADLCNPILAPPMSKRIADKLGEEFKAQAELEREKGLAVTVMLAPTVQKQGDMELGFIQFVVKPLYEMLSRLAPDLEVCLHRIDANTKMWGELQKAPPETAGAQATKAAAGAGGGVVSA